MNGRRSRTRIVVALIVVVALGLGSRRFRRFLPSLVGLYAGDVLWALMVYLGFIFVRPSMTKRMAATLALSFALFIEMSQLYHAPWIDSLRANPLGGLVLGFGFLWSDLICYGVGVSFGGFLDGNYRNLSLNTDDSICELDLPQHEDSASA